MMKITPDSLELLKNFSGINQSILLTTNNKLNTIAESKDVLAQADISEKFDKEFGIFDLNEFLATLSLFKDPSFKLIDDMFLDIKDDIKGSRSSCKYFKADVSVIVEMPSTEKILKAVKTAEINFELTEDDLNALLKAAGTLQSKCVCVESFGKNIFVSASDPDNSTANSYSIDVGKGIGKKFKMIFKTQNLNMLLKGDYQVSISKNKIAQFKNSVKSLIYWVALEDSSTYTE